MPSNAAQSPCSVLVYFTFLHLICPIYVTAAMAAQCEWQDQRKGLKRSVDGHKAHCRRVVAKLEEAIVEAEEQCPHNFRPALPKLCDANEDVAKVAGTGSELVERSDSVYEHRLQELQNWKDRVEFTARYVAAFGPRHLRKGLTFAATSAHYCQAL